MQVEIFNVTLLAQVPKPPVEEEPAPRPILQETVGAATKIVVSHLANTEPKKQAPGHDFVEKKMRLSMKEGTALHEVARRAEIRAQFPSGTVVREVSVERHPMTVDYVQ